MEIKSFEVANWGLFPKINATVAFPENTTDARGQVAQWPRLIARGAGKCYGDAALANHIISTTRLNRILHFDAVHGVVECEAGALLQDVLDQAIPAGWFLHVTPGIKLITVGGAIASDVHGKNHPSKGCFSNWVEWFDLLRADGSVLRCSRSEHADLFWQTQGGMGWTGVILAARFRLMPLPSDYMRQSAVRADNLEALFRAFDDHRNWSYAAGWVDCLTTGPRLGRGVVFLAEHADAPPAKPPKPGRRRPANVPFFMPTWLLNRYSIGLHNDMMFSKAETGERLVELDAYFYPLDRIRNWNRLYGRRGFIQYQFCLPEAVSFDGIRQVLEIIHAHKRDLPFLTVLKRHGERPPEALHSFPIRGYSLAMDFPRTRSVFELVQKLDERVWKLGGKIYLAKDAGSAPRMGRLDPRTFGEGKFSSLLKDRILHK